MSKLTKPVLRVLERIFAAEVEGRAPLYMHGSMALKRAMDEGLVEKIQWQHDPKDGLPPVRLTGYELTHRGRYAYGCACKDEPEPAAEDA